MARTGRPRGFVDADVVGGAKGLFWRRGYAATSLRELAEEIGVLSGSLYGAFGSKHELFLRALRDYADATQAAAAELASAESAIPAIRAFLEGALEAAVSTPGRGCMFGNAAVELLPHDEAARRVVQSGLRTIEDGFAQALIKGQRLGGVRNDVDCRVHARLLVALVQGLHVTARAETDPHRLDQVIDAALAALAPPEEAAAPGNRHRTGQ